MLILGIASAMDAGAVLIADGTLVAAVNEERLTRVKNQAGFPERSIEYIFARHGIGWADLDGVASHGAPQAPDEVLAHFQAKDEEIVQSALDLERKQAQLIHLWRRYGKERAVRAVRIPGQLKLLTDRHPHVLVYAHHLAHAASAYFFSPVERAHLLTADGWGEDGSSLVGSATGTDLSVWHRSPSISSLGYFYGAVTHFLGFTPHRHEGKVLGLAAHGDASKTGPLLARLIRYDPRTMRLDGRYDEGFYVTHYRNPHLAELLDGFSVEDVAAGAQEVLESCVRELVDRHFDIRLPLCVAGGVFANVRLNQLLAEHPMVDGLHVPPHMGDGGLALGVAALAHRDLTGERMQPPDNAYLGGDYGPREIEAALRGSGLPYRSVTDIDAVVADLLANGDVVARVDGRMEYGARALGNRSVLAPATDPGITAWLNERLSRSEFMPFAPVTLHEHAPSHYHDHERLWPNTKIMTITARCTERMRAESPACVHVDGTARPQLIRAEDNPRYYNVVRRYYERTRIPTLINTSFNIHDEPIVESPSDAVRALTSSGLRYLAIGEYLVENR